VLLFSVTISLFCLIGFPSEAPEHLHTQGLLAGFRQLRHPNSCLGVQNPLNPPLFPSSFLDQPRSLLLGPIIPSAIPKVSPFLSYLLSSDTSCFPSCYGRFGKRFFPLPFDRHPSLVPNFFPRKRDPSSILPCSNTSWRADPYPRCYYPVSLLFPEDAAAPPTHP